MKNELLAAVISATILFSASAANAVVITFNDVTPESGEINQLSGGFNFQVGFAGWLYTVPGGAVETGFNGNPHSSIRLAGSGASNAGNKADLPGPGVVMTEMGGGTFSVFSFEAATFAITQLTDTLTVEGVLSSGGTVSTDFDLTTSFQTFLLSGFESLTSLSFYSTVAGGSPLDGFQIDTIDTMGVPEPGTLALFGLGLAGLGVARRRRVA